MSGMTPTGVASIISVLMEFPEWQGDHHWMKENVYDHYLDARKCLALVSGVDNFSIFV